MVSKLTLVCIKLALALGKVFLNRSKASSSFRTLIVSAKATNSSARVFDRSSHSAVFVAQLFSKFAMNSLSAIKAASVSVMSSFISTISMPSSPMRFNFFSISAVKASTSAFFAAIKSSYVLIASSSVFVALAKSAAMVSHEITENLSRLCLQESCPHSFLQGCHCFHNSRNCCIALSFVGSKDGCFFFTQGGGLCHRCLCSCSVCLCPLHITLQSFQFFFS